VLIEKPCSGSRIHAASSRFGGPPVPIFGRSGRRVGGGQGVHGVGEDFRSDRAPCADALEGCGGTHDVELALTRQAAKAKQVLDQGGRLKRLQRVGELDLEDLLAGHLAQKLEVGVGAEEVPGVEAQARVGPVRAPHDVPAGLKVDDGGDGHELQRDPQAPRPGAVGERAECIDQRRGLVRLTQPLDAIDRSASRSSAIRRMSASEKSTKPRDSAG
jgi:hypothetical protein